MLNHLLLAAFAFTLELVLSSPQCFGVWMHKMNSIKLLPVSVCSIYSKTSRIMSPKSQDLEQFEDLSFNGNALVKKHS